MRVLLVEDDLVLGPAVADQIMADGHSVDRVTTLDEAQSALMAFPFDLILLDLLLPDGRGIPFLKSLRSRGDATPVIIITALDQVSDRIAGLQSGADDYLVKPFDLSELSARIGSVSRRYAGNPNPLIRHGDLDIDIAGRTVLKSGVKIALTNREWAIFEALLQRPNQVVGKSQIEEVLSNFDTSVGPNTIEVHISHLRKKIGKDVILTERGLGYRLGQP